MTVFVSYTGMMLWPIRQLGRILSDLGKAIVSFGRTSDILLAKPEQDDPDSLTPPLDRDIEFDHVGFEHEDSTPVLKDIHFTVKQGQTVAILGATGSGQIHADEPVAAPVRRETRRDPHRRREPEPHLASTTCGRAWGWCCRSRSCTPAP